MRGRVQKILSAVPGWFPASSGCFSGCFSRGETGTLSLAFVKCFEILCQKVLHK